MTHPQPADPGASNPAPTSAPPAPNPPEPSASTPASVQVPPLVAPVPVRQTPPANGGTGQQPGQQAPATGTGSPDGFPPNTPWRDMQPAEQVAYWQHQARKHEQRVREQGDYDQLRQKAEQYEALVAASQTEHERAVAEARRHGHAEALAAAGGQLVEQWLRAAAAGRLGEESVNALLAGLDRQRFLTAQGGVDTDKVYALVNSVAPPPASAPAVSTTGTPGQQPAAATVVWTAGQVQPVPQPVQASAGVPQVAAPTRGPDFGQGQPGAAKLSGLARGRERARQRFGTSNAQPAAQ